MSELQQRSGGAAALLQGLYDFLPGSLLQDLGRFLGGIWRIVAMSHVKHDSRKFHAKHERRFGKTDDVIRIAKPVRWDIAIYLEGVCRDPRNLL